MVKFKKFIATVMVAVGVTLGGLAFSATPAAPVIQKAQAASYVSCYKSMFGDTWCWRYNCTWFEQYALGCYTGWVRTNSTWWA